MSFFNTLSRGFGRSSKKTSKTGSPQQQQQSPAAATPPPQSQSPVKSIHPYSATSTANTNSPALGTSTSSTPHASAYNLANSSTPNLSVAQSASSSGSRLQQQQQQLQLQQQHAPPHPPSSSQQQQITPPAPLAQPAQKPLFSMANSSSHSLLQSSATSSQHQLPSATSSTLLNKQGTQQQLQQQPQPSLSLKQGNNNSSINTTSATNNNTPTNNPASSALTNKNNNNTTSSSSTSTTSTAVAPVMKPLFLCQPFVRTALVRGSFQTLVQVPRYVDQNEWLVLNVFEFYQYLNLFYGAISEFVTPQTCPTMNAGPGIDYTWIDSNKKQVHLPANTYIDLVLTWISNKFDDTTLFPTKQGVPFPPHFLGVLKSIYRQMFRIFAHIYHNHFDKFVHLSMEAHWNSFFAHFISFGKEFDLLDKKEMEPLLPLIEAMEAQGKIMMVDHKATSSSSNYGNTLSPNNAIAAN